MKNKFKKLSLLLIVPVFIASSLYGIIAPQVAYAAPIDEPNIDRNIKSYLYYTALARCIDKALLKDRNSPIGTYNRIDEDHAINGQWFYSLISETTGVGEYIKKGGEEKCGDSSWINTALSLWGFNDTLEALCSFGFRRETEKPCKESDAQFERKGNAVNDFKNAVKNSNYYGGKEPTLTGAMKYLLYSQSFIKGCGAELPPIGPYEGANPQDKARADNTSNDNTYYKLNVVAPDGKNVVNTIYKAKDERENSSKITDVSTTTYSMLRASCQRLTELANANSVAFASYIQENQTDKSPAPGNTAAGGGTAEDLPCNDSGALGWIVCPAIYFLEGIIEKVSGLLSELLTTKPLTFDTGSDTYQIWSNVRNLANIAFVIAFMVVIYSQATSAGLSNYGVKRMLPRIIAAAILVNLSYFLCAVAIDLSNIAGAGVGNILQATGQVVKPDLTGGFTGNFDLKTGFGASLAVIGGSALVIFYLIPILITILVTLLVIAFRTALILLLTLISPLAFVAWILPSTEKYFKKWLDLFVAMLVLYPMLIAVFAGASVAAKVVGSTGGAGQAVVALLIQALPLFALPFLFKTASGVLGRIENMSSAGVKKYGGDQAGEAVKSTRKRHMANIGGAMATNKLGFNEDGTEKAGAFGRFQRGTGVIASRTGGYSAKRKFMSETQKANADKAQQEAIANRLENSRFAKQAAGVAGGAQGAAIAQARGVSLNDQLIGEQIKAGQTLIDNAQLDQAQRLQLAKTGSATYTDMNGATKTLKGDFLQRSAASAFVAQGRTGAVMDIARSGNLSKGARASLAYNIAQNYDVFKRKGHLLNSDIIKNKLAQGEAILDADLEAAAANKMHELNAEQLSTQENGALAITKSAIDRGIIDATKAAMIRGRRDEAIANEVTRGNFNAESGATARLL